MADGAALLCSSISEWDLVQSNSKLWIWFHACATSGCISEQLPFHNAATMVVYKHSHSIVSNVGIMATAGLCINQRRIVSLSLSRVLLLHSATQFNLKLEKVKKELLNNNTHI